MDRHDSSFQISERLPGRRGWISVLPWHRGQDKQQWFKTKAKLILETAQEEAFFTVRTVSSAPREVKESTLLEIFKRKLDMPWLGMI